MATFDLSRWFAGLGGANANARACEATPEANARVRHAVETLPVMLFEFDANGIDKPFESESLLALIARQVARRPVTRSEAV